jgi:hypothetical protein
VHISPTQVVPPMTADVSYCRCMIVAIMERSFCFDQVHYPIREHSGLYRSEQGRQFKVGVNIDQAGHENSIGDCTDSVARISF